MLTRRNIICISWYHAEIYESWKKCLSMLLIAEPVTLVCLHHLSTASDCFKAATLTFTLQTNKSSVRCHAPLLPYPCEWVGTDSFMPSRVVVSLKTFVLIRLIVPYFFCAWTSRDWGAKCFDNTTNSPAHLKKHSAAWRINEADLGIQCLWAMPAHLFQALFTKP